MNAPPAYISLNVRGSQKKMNDVLSIKGGRTMYIKECEICLNDTEVIDTRTTKDGMIRRKRICRSCGHTFYTIEVFDDKNIKAALEILRNK